MTRLFRFAKTLFVRSLREFQRDNCMQTAAAISYYVLFSLFPLLIFLAGILGLFLRSDKLQQDVINAVLDNIPLDQGQGRQTVTDAVRGVAGAGSTLLGVIGLLGMAWAGSNVFGVIRNALNKAYRVESRRPYFQQKAMDLGLVMGFGLFFLVSIGATAFLRIVRARSDEIAFFGDLARRAGFLWDASSYLIPLVFSFIGFGVLYTLVPAAHKRLADVWPGALFAATVFEIAKLAFSIYLEHFSRYDLVFGSLGAVASFLFWVYLSSNIMLFGAEMASVYPQVRAGEHDQGPGPPLRTEVWRFVRGLFVRE